MQDSLSLCAGKVVLTVSEPPAEAASFYQTGGYELESTEFTPGPSFLADLLVSNVESQIATVNFTSAHLYDSKNNGALLHDGYLRLYQLFTLFHRGQNTQPEYTVPGRTRGVLWTSRLVMPSVLLSTWRTLVGPSIDKQDCRLVLPAQTLLLKNAALASLCLTVSAEDMSAVNSAEWYFESVDLAAGN